jgi:hypothetical protein
MMLAVMSYNVGTKAFHISGFAVATLLGISVGYLLFESAHITKNASTKARDQAQAVACH